MVYVLLGTGFEEIEALAPVDLMRRAGIRVLTVGVNGKTVYGGHGIGIEADILLDEIDLTELEMVVLPGGLGGVPPYWRICTLPTASRSPAIRAAKTEWAVHSLSAVLPVSGTEI